MQGCEDKGLGESQTSSATLSRKHCKRSPVLGKLLGLPAVGAEVIAEERWLVTENMAHSARGLKWEVKGVSVKPALGSNWKWGNWLLSRIPWQFMESQRYKWEISGQVAHWADTGTYFEVIMKNMKLNLLCWLPESAAWEECWDLLRCKCRGAPGVAHSTADGCCHRAHSVLLQGVAECGLLLFWHSAEALDSLLSLSCGKVCSGFWRWEGSHGPWSQRLENVHSRVPMEEPCVCRCCHLVYC